MIFRIAEDVIERRLELIGRRTVGQAILQTFLLLVVISFFGAFFTGIGSSFLSKMPPDWVSRFDCWWRLTAAFAIMGLPALLIASLVLRAIMTMSAGWHRLAWDGRAGELVALRRGGWFGLSETTSIPLGEIQRIDLHAAPGGKSLTLTLTIHSGKQQGRAPLEATVRVRHVDRREEAMDLLFRIGRMCGLAYYSVEQSDLRNLKVQLVRESAGAERFQLLPGGSSSSRYEDDVVSEGISAPAPRVEKFRRKTFEKFVSGTRLVAWQPGKLVQLFQPAPDAAAYLVFSAGAAALAGFFAYHAAPLAKDWLPWWGTMIVAMLAAPLLACLATWLFCPDREVIFDWATGQVTWRTGKRKRSAPLTAIEQLVLRGIKKKVHRKKQSDYTNYSCALEMIVEGRTVELLESNKFRELPDAPAERLGPLAQALSESLNVPWQWREYD
jgi:hypothetical protein